MATVAAAAGGDRAAELARYLGGGLLCAGLNSAIVIGADRAGVHYVGGVVLATLLVTPVGYVWQTLVTFRGDLAWRRFAAFAGSILAGFALSLALMALLCSMIGLSVAVASPVTTVAVTTWNYLRARRAILRPLRSGPRPARTRADAR